MSQWTRPELSSQSFRDPTKLSTLLGEYGLQLTAEEIELASKRFGRHPRWAELICLNVLWSEHCSYRSTRHLLSRLPTQAPQVLMGPGQDAGIVTIGEKDGVSFAAVLAHESHNHPSQVVPYEGAATGVGGIVRDVACMGARVTGTLDALRFGTGARRGGAATRDIIREVVRGVADYGNALGVPNLGGDVYFDDGFDGNCLVNVVAIGVVPVDGIIPSAAPGDLDCALILVGKPTDDSGFGGAAFASTVLSEEESARRGAVQLPDPFLLRALTVANESLVARARKRGWNLGCKDLGAGGLACASVELVAASGLGADIWIDKVPRVPEPIPGWVLLCAETQERYCWAVPWELREEVCGIFNEQHRIQEVYPGASAAVIGRTRRDGIFRVTSGEEVLVECPSKVLTEGIKSPRESRPRTRTESVASGPEDRGGKAPSNREVAVRLLTGPALGSRSYLYERYDPDVQGLTAVRRGEAPAGVIAPVEGATWGMAVAVAGNPYYGRADAYWAAAHAVCEAARSVIAVGATPWALSDCLNFGSALDPEVMGDLEEAVRGLGDAATALGTTGTDSPLPFITGNVSLYNQDEVGHAIPPSAIVSCLGRVEDLSRILTPGLKGGETVLLYVGPERGNPQGSHYARVFLSASSAAGLPNLDLAMESRRQALVLGWIDNKRVHSCGVVGEGGLAKAIIGMAFSSPAGLGANLDLKCFEKVEASAQELLWSEEPGYLLEVSRDVAQGMLADPEALQAGTREIGRTLESFELQLDTNGERDSIDLPTLVQPWRNALQSVWKLEDEGVEVTS